MSNLQNSRPRLAVAGLVAITALAIPAGADAHVTVQPPQAAAGGYTVLNVRVPNEQDDQGTVKVEVRFPAGVATASYQRIPGWTVKTTTRKASTPIEVHGEQVTDEVGTVTFTGNGREGRIGPGQFQDFPLSVRVPDGKPGTALTFKALQTYEDGEVVRWIGAADGDRPAPQLTLTAAADEHGSGAADVAEAADGDSGTGSAEVVASTSDDGDGNSGWAIALGGAGLAAGLAGLGVALASRRRHTA